MSDARDIVERLKLVYEDDEWDEVVSPPNVLIEAAAEITRLRGELAAFVDAGLATADGKPLTQLRPLVVQLRNAAQAFSDEVYDPLVKLATALKGQNPIALEALQAMNLTTPGDADAVEYVAHVRGQCHDDCKCCAAEAAAAIQAAKESK